MGHKPISPRTHIHMLARVGFINPACHQQVLPEVFASGDAALLVAIMQTGHELQRTLVVAAEDPQIA